MSASKPAGYIAISAQQKLTDVIREAMRVARPYGEAVNIDRKLGTPRLAVGEETLRAWQAKNKPAKKAAKKQAAAAPVQPSTTPEVEAAVKKVVKKAAKKAAKKAVKKVAKKTAKKQAGNGGNGDA